MSGVAAIRYLLANSVPLTAVVPAARIKAGELPLKTVLPAISVTQISSVPRLTVAMTETSRLHTERVQVTVMVKNTDGEPAGSGYPSLRSILRLVLAACPNTCGTVNGVHLDSVLPAEEGPDIPDMEMSFITGSRDFIVKLHA